MGKDLELQQDVGSIFAVIVQENHLELGRLGVVELAPVRSQLLAKLLAMNGYLRAGGPLFEEDSAFIRDLRPIGKSEIGPTEILRIIGIYYARVPLEVLAAEIIQAAADAFTDFPNERFLLPDVPVYGKQRDAGEQHNSEGYPDGFTAKDPKSRSARRHADIFAVRRRATAHSFVIPAGPSTSR